MTSLAEAAGLDTDNGIVVDRYLRSSDANIWAAGDAAGYPDQRLGKPIRVEHWVLAERHGQVAALNMVGRGVRSVMLRSSGASTTTCASTTSVTPRAGIPSTSPARLRRDALLAYRENGSITAVATIGRDMASLQAQVAMERGDDNALERLL